MHEQHHFVDGKFLSRLCDQDEVGDLVVVAQPTTICRQYFQPLLAVGTTHFLSAISTEPMTMGTFSSDDVV